MNYNYIHLSTETIEKNVIILANKFSNIKHDYDDCGDINFKVNSLDFILINNDNVYQKILPKNYLNAFISLQISLQEEFEYQNFFNSLNEFLKKYNIKISKGETTFLNNGKTYGVLVLGYYDNKKNYLCKPEFNLIGTIDTYVLERHFSLEKDPIKSAFYTTLASISDIGACGGTPLYLKVKFINPITNKNNQNHLHYKEIFIKGIKKACRFIGINNYEFTEDHIDKDLGKMVVVFVVIGSVSKKQKLTLKGLKKRYENICFRCSWGGFIF